jgi:hypothetical protein
MYFVEDNNPKIIKFWLEGKINHKIKIINKNTNVKKSTVSQKTQ